MLASSSLGSLSMRDTARSEYFDSFNKLTIASPQGGPAILDPISVEIFKSDEYCMYFSKNEWKLWLETEKLENFTERAKEFDAIFYISGFGPMFDLVENPISLALINEFHSSNRIVSAVCHESTALLNVRLPDGTLYLKGEPVTGFSNAKEIAVNIQKDLPFHLEIALDDASGGNYKKAEKAWDPWVAVSKTKKFLAGRNPGRAKPLAEVLLKVLQEEKAKPGIW